MRNGVNFEDKSNKISGIVGKNKKFKKEQNES
jgi:hypothetical protein